MTRVIVWENGKRVVKDSSGEPVQMTLERERALMRCTPAQMRLALKATDNLAAVENLVQLNSDALIMWEYATVIERNSPFIKNLNIGDPPPFTEEEIDNLFRLARSMT